MLVNTIDILVDPIDGTDLKFGDAERVALRSEPGHSYDVVHQGYATLAGGAGLHYISDDAKMITARKEFLSGDHYAPFVEAATGNIQDVLDDANVSEAVSPVIREVGVGTNYCLAHTLDSIPNSRGVGIDASVPVAKYLAESHPRLDAVAVDVWARLLLRDGSISVPTTVFAPRNAEEFARTLKPSGQVVVPTAATGHLDELRESLGIIDVKCGKAERTTSQAENHLMLISDPEPVEFDANLNQSVIVAQIDMSPSTYHIHPEALQECIAALPAEIHVAAHAYVTRLGHPGD